MTAIAALECVRRQAASTSRSAMYWSVLSIVSMTPWPGVDGLSTVGDPPTSRPSASRPTMARPAAAGQRAVPGLLHTRQALAVHALEADGVGGQLPVRIETQALVDEPERRHVELRERPRRRPGGAGA